ncbi:MAG: MotA/TolQ/ExbB proton channel family protein [Phycisphaeraceae bacterium]|nr:MotA/TolQ/ExbB proton channel family protein [Phycisphaeraceae bacterium]
MKQRTTTGRFPMSMVGLAMGLIITLSATALMAASEVSGIDATTGQGPTMIELFNTSPVINGLILLLSVFAVVFFLFFVTTINTSTLAPQRFVDDVNKLVLAKKFDEAATFCRSHQKIFIASVIQRCVENSSKDHSVIMDMVDSEGKRRSDILWNRVSYLADIANVAPMLGLLGTVVGMINAFFAMKFESLSASSSALTTSIGAAMATTMFGLIVAIFATFCYSIVKSRLTRSLAVAEEVAHSLADHMKRGEA